MKYFEQFGGPFKSRHKKKFARSKHWDGEKFVNYEAVTLDFNWTSLPELIRKQFFEKDYRQPSEPIPYLPFDKQKFLAPSERMKAIWYGHSVVMMRLNEKTLIIDPMFGDNASPITPVVTKRFSENTIQLIDDFPDIDYVLFTHDHYDHLDYDSIQKIKPKVKHYLTGLGLGRHLVQWGVPKNKITEFDWWQTENFDGLDITFTPSRHMSGRRLTDRSKSLWGGWVFKTSNECIYFSGDGGYGKHFKEVGKKLGPFDFGWIECGQYNDNWRNLHLHPEESVQAVKDARIAKVMTIHWAGFALAPHHWKEPVTRFMKAAEEARLSVLHPRIGELFDINSIIAEKWWEDLD